MAKNFYELTLADFVGVSKQANPDYRVRSSVKRISGTEKNKLGVSLVLAVNDATQQTKFRLTHSQALSSRVETRGLILELKVQAKGTHPLEAKRKGFSEKAKPAEGSEPDPLEVHTVAELKVIAETLSIDVPSSAKKQDIIDLINAKNAT